MGLSEKYMLYLAACLLPASFGFVIGRVFIGAFTGCIIVFTIMAAAFFYFQRLSIKHGNHGMDKMKAYGKRPRVITVNSRSVFLSLKK